jgi:hypothetical protein
MREVLRLLKTLPPEAAVGTASVVLAMITAAYGKQMNRNRIQTRRLAKVMASDFPGVVLKIFDAEKGPWE